MSLKKGEREQTVKSLNNVQLIGNLTKNPELKQTNNGNSVTSFSLALNRSVKNGDTWDEVTDYVDCVAWGKLADTVAEYVNKGQKLFVQGRIQTRSYDKDGQKRYVTEVVVSDVVFMDSKAKTQDVVPEDIDDNTIDLSTIPF